MTTLSFSDQQPYPYLLSGNLDGQASPIEWWEASDFLTELRSRSFSTIYELSTTPITTMQLSMSSTRHLARLARRQSKLYWRKQRYERSLCGLLYRISRRGDGTQPLSCRYLQHRALLCSSGSCILHVRS